jgi:hypothetical protein
MPTAGLCRLEASDRVFGLVKGGAWLEVVGIIPKL